MSERLSDREDDDKQGGKANNKDSAAAPAERAKEREMDESGEENPA